MEDFRPDVLEAFQALVATGSVELLGETYYHSLASLYSREEFARQVILHRDKIRELFGVTPRVFRNTELVYSNRIAVQAEELGFSGILAEGVPWKLPGQSANYLVQSPGVRVIKTLLRNASLSDDLAFRFSDASWKEHPLAAPRYLGWIESLRGDVVNLFLDLEAIGEHQWEDTGIFRFLEEFVALGLERGADFVTPGEAVEEFRAERRYECDIPASWADSERDPSAWLGNVMQREACLKIHALEQSVKATGNGRLVHAWSKLQSSDHFHYMSTKEGTDGMVHRYFSPHESPYDGGFNLLSNIAPWL